MTINFLICIGMVALCSIFVAAFVCAIFEHIKRRWYFLVGLGIAGVIMHGTFIVVWTLRMLEVI